MCGIAGIISDKAVEPRTVRRMINPIAHRGPDDEGVWIDAELGVGLGHRRLAIVDLSPSGHQPMLSSDGRYVLCYNGEIYNHAALRREVESAGGGPPGGAWRGHSDTETLVEAIALWGLETTTQKCVGMFALALWDRLSRHLQLARDRFGEKPLYYGWAGGDFMFGSELKALRSHPAFREEIDRLSLRQFAGRTYIPAPRSIYRDVFKLEPGHILTIPRELALDITRRPQARAYWSYRQVLRDGLADPFRSEDEALEALELALAESIRGQSMADVPVGAFLSGGIDSSTVVALYQAHSANCVRTYSIGFEEAGFNEAEYAKAVARHFGTEHHERYVTVREAQAVIPRLPAIYDEPFADSSQIPTHLVSEFARGEVTVALSGDGGDELFGGYDRYFAVAQLMAAVGAVPGPLRKIAGAALEQVPNAAWRAVMALSGRNGKRSELGFKMARTARRIRHSGALEKLYPSFLDDWWGEASPVVGAPEDDAIYAFDTDLGADAPATARMMYCDAVSYLSDDILCKVDRAAMAVSLETRVPFLDHRVAAVAARLHVDMKMRDGKGKYLLRKLLYRHAPKELFERPKAGFGVPVGQWIRGPLRPWAEDLLNRDRMKRDGFFDADRIHRRWQQHLRGERDATQAIWSVLMFQAWRDAQIPALAAA